MTGSGKNKETDYVGAKIMRFAAVIVVSANRAIRHPSVFISQGFHALNS